MKIKHIFAALLCSTALTGSFTACQDLNVGPKSLLTNDAIYNEDGIEAYMAGLYGRLPMEDFNVTNEGNNQGYFHFNSIGWTMVLTGESVNKNYQGWNAFQKGYYSNGYLIIRQCNQLIDDLPQYRSQLGSSVDNWIAEAKFLRAYTYFAMVKRYGGVPLIMHAQQMPEDLTDLAVARSSHEECVDSMLSDLDYAIANLSTNKVAGRANRYVAAAFKSRVALYAGSIAKYGQKYAFTSSTTGTELTGIPESRKDDYFRQAYEAAKVVEQGGYELYRGNSDKEENFAEIFTNADDSKESVFVRQYSQNNYVHSFDILYLPKRYAGDWGGRYMVTLDWVELFDGMDKDPETGHLQVLDEDGFYKVYDGPTDIWKNWEPRLRGSLMLPGKSYMGQEMDIRGGIIDEDIETDEPIDKFIEDDGKTTTAYSNVSFVRNNIYRATGDPRTQANPYVLSDGTKLYKNGLDGPCNQAQDFTFTGFYGRKWLNLNLPVGGARLHYSTQTWIDIRYAEVLLNRAEAALELYQDGVTSIDGQDLRVDCFNCINDVRERGGATLLTSPEELSEVSREGIERGQGVNSFVYAPNEGLHKVRVERYKELAFEHKVYWDLRRWFTFDQQIYQYRRRELVPFLFGNGAKLNENGNPEGKYIYDTRCCETGAGNITFATKYYYDPIPNGERLKNHLLEQNNQY